MRPQSAPTQYQPRLLGAAVLWLLGGSALLLTTLVPMHPELLGWTPAFGLIGAPPVILLPLEPTLPRQVFALCQPRRRALCSVVWH